jgi:hypothetical protein
MAVEQRAIDGDAKALGARQLDGGHRLVEHTLEAHRLVVALAVAIQVDGEGQVWRGLILVDVLREQYRVGAEVDEFLALHDAGDDLRHLLVNQGFAARNGDDGRAAFVHGLERILDTHPLLQDLLRIVDLAAAGAGQVALEQRLEHEHQGVSLVAPELAPGEVFCDPIHLQ